MAKVHGPATPRGMQRIVDVVRHVERSPGYSLNPGPRAPAQVFTDWHSYRNNGSHEVPPHGIIELTALQTDSGAPPTPLWDATRPTNTLATCYAVNGSVAVSAGSYGVCKMTDVVDLVYDSSDTPAWGQSWGFKPDQFEASRGFLGFTCLGIVRPSEKIMRARVLPVESLDMLGKRTGLVTMGSQGNFTVWLKTGSSFTAWAASTIEVTCECPTTAYAANKWATLEYKSGRWIAIQAECGS